MTYDVYGYKTQEDFDNRDYVVVDEGLTRRKDAMKIGKDSLNEYAVIKVQSDDREFIEILNIRTGVLDTASIKPDMLDEQLINNAIDIAWEEAIEGKTQDEIEELGDCWECSDTTYLYGFIKDADDKYIPDPDQDLSVIVNMGNGCTLQILQSKYIIDNVGFCSPCYPGQADLDSDGNLTAYILPPEYFIKGEFDTSKIREI